MVSQMPTSEYKKGSLCTPVTPSSSWGWLMVLLGMDYRCLKIIRGLDGTLGRRQACKGGFVTVAGCFRFLSCHM